MELYKCDRCGKLGQKDERMLACVDNDYSDLCPVCWEEYKEDLKAATKLYEKQKHAIAVKYGIKMIMEIMDNGQNAERQGS